VIVPSDQDYIETKLILQGKKSLDPLLIELSNWIRDYFSCKVINIYANLVAIRKNRPRLEIVFEDDETVLKFRDKIGNYDKEKQKLIADKFRELILKQSLINNNVIKHVFRNNSEQIDLNSLFVVFTAFEPVARIDASWRIPNEIVEDFENELSIENIWKIYRDFSSTTFFFHTTEQMNKAISSDSAIKIRSRWYALIKSFDEFDYIKRDDQFLFFSSKEILDEKYAGNLFNYTRR
jgi:translation initiation factor 2 beta subunit (eIF-2beta)/eIF-5